MMSVSELKFINQEKAKELQELSDIDLQALISNSMIKIDEINHAKKNDDDYKMVRGQLKTIEDGYKDMLGREKETIEYSRHLLKLRYGKENI